MNLNEIITRVLRTHNEQHTFCYCPLCKNELVGSASFVSDTDEGVTYKCTTCGRKSLWWFDDPVPILLKHQALTKQMSWSANARPKRKLANKAHPRDTDKVESRGKS